MPGAIGRAGARSSGVVVGAAAGPPPPRTLLVELLLFGRPLQGERRGEAARDRLGDEVEVPGADLALVPSRRVAAVLHRKLALLELDVGAHPAVAVPARQLERRRVQRVEAGERDE